MDNRQLLYFFTITQEGSISRAAEKLHIAQPYLSRQLKMLEDELGITLIERSTRKFHITEAGKVLAYRAKQMLDLSDSTVKELQDLGNGVKGTLSIGCVSSALETLLLRKISAFHQQYEAVDFEVRQGSTKEILELLTCGIIEIGMIRSPLNSETFASISMPLEPMVAVIHSNIFSFAGKTVSLKQLAAIPLLVHRRFEQDIVKLFHEQNLRPRIICKVEDTRPLLLLAAQEMGAAIIPRDWTQLIHESHLKTFAIKELTLDTGAVVVWLNNHYLTSAAKHFLDCFR